LLYYSISVDNILVQDELAAETPVAVTWIMHTQAAIDIDQSGSHATLTLNGKELQAYILSPAGACFNKAEVTLQLPQIPLENERKLLINLPQKIKNVRITVLLIPGKSDDRLPKLVSLDEWK
jgi:hypothetical protein